MGHADQEENQPPLLKDYAAPVLALPDLSVVPLQFVRVWFKCEIQTGSSVLLGTQLVVLFGEVIGILGSGVWLEEVK